MRNTSSARSPSVLILALTMLMFAWASVKAIFARRPGRSPATISRMKVRSLIVGEDLHFGREWKVTKVAARAADGWRLHRPLLLQHLRKLELDDLDGIAICRRFRRADRGTGERVERIAVRVVWIFASTIDKPARPKKPLIGPNRCFWSGR
jgi:hypothetical protein